MARRGSRTTLAAVVVLLAGTASVVGASSAPAADPPPLPPLVPAGFEDREVIEGLSEATSVAFAPDGTAFVGLKPGQVKSFDYDPATGDHEDVDDPHTDVVALYERVHNYHDRGLTGIALDPEFGTPGGEHDYVYVNYAYDRDPRDATEPPQVPAWGTGDPGYDDCAEPAAMPTALSDAVEGCVGVTRVSRIPVEEGPDGWVAAGPEEPLVDLPAGQGACQQFGSHASGDVAFGPDGLLYASAGDGASFDSLDYGQAGNPCDDPVDEGGALRAQDIRTTGDPLGLGGTIFRIDPDAGAVTPGDQANAARIVTYGQRNPWRLTFRPGTDQLWSADVGASGFEEVNRTDLDDVSGPVNLGWPCYEGAYTGLQRNAGWDGLEIDMCETLYAQPSTVQAPWFSYPTRADLGGPLTDGEDCRTGTSSVSGIAFVPATSSYPEQYRGAMFFNDYARSCIWYLEKDPNGDPDPTSIQPFVQRAESPVQVEIGPGGDLFYVDYGIVGDQVVAGAAGIHRLTHSTGNLQPVARLTASPTEGATLPLEVDFDASASSDPNEDPLVYAWDLDGDGQFDDGGSSATESFTYGTAVNVTVSVRVSDEDGGVDTESVLVSPGNTSPQITDVSPGSGFTWVAGQTVTLQADAVDAEEGVLPDDAYAWSVSIRHCPSDCHTHSLTGGTGKQLEFTTLGHEYPSDLLIALTVTDGRSLKDSQEFLLQPKTVDLGFATQPAGGAMTVAGTGVFSPHVQRFIVGSTVDMAVPAVRTVGGVTYDFAGWSDGGGLAHSATAPAAPTVYTATYVARPGQATGTLVVRTKPGGLRVKVDGVARRDGYSRTWAAGTAVRVSAPRTQWLRGVRYRFVRWSDGGRRTHLVTVDEGWQRVRAVYRRD